MRNIAIIPARSGSKGLKDKNIKDLCGKPLMAYSIEAAIKSNVFDEVMVSTDSTEYAKIAEECGASVPFLRSEITASDKATTWDMVKEVVYKYRELGEEFDTICVLQPTSPLRTANNIMEAYRVFAEKSALSVISVCESEHSPLWANVLPEDDSLKGFLDADVFSKGGRQGLGVFYRLNGAIYICTVDKEKNFEDQLYGDGCFAYIMDQKLSVDIDNIDDFELAEYYMQKEKK